MEHSVCKVSLAHYTKEWLSALFEALDGLELSVNNYLFTLLWIACRNKRLYYHLYRSSPPNSLWNKTKLWHTGQRNRKSWYSQCSHRMPFAPFATQPASSFQFFSTVCSRQLHVPSKWQRAPSSVSQTEEATRIDPVSGESSPWDVHCLGRALGQENKTQCSFLPLSSGHIFCFRVCHPFL